MSRGLDPTGAEAARQLAHDALDRALDDFFTAAAGDGAVWQPMPDDVRARLRSSVDGRATPVDELLDEYARDVLPYALGNRHPRFFGWVHGGGTFAGALGEMLAGFLNANLGGRDHAPVEIERAVIAWALRTFGFPAGGDGLLCTGTSQATLIAILAARTRALPNARREGSGAAQLVAYAAAGAHSSIARALEIAGIGSGSLRAVAVDPAGALDVAALAAAIAADRAAGMTPWLVIATLGSVGTGAVDPLAAIAAVCAREGLWLHVDGAFGALVALAPSLRHHAEGLERADSLAFDFHKWAQVPYDAGALIVRDRRCLTATFAERPDYLAPSERGLGAGAPWFVDLGPDLSRGFRALKVWMTLRAHGDAALGRVVERTCALARRLAARVEATPPLVVAAPPVLDIVCFRATGAGSDEADDALNARIVEDLQIAGIAAPSTTRLGGRLVARAAIVNHRTEEADVDLLVDAYAERARRTI